jgi:hypothetical protein
MLLICDSNREYLSSAEGGSIDISRSNLKKKQVNLEFFSFIKFIFYLPGRRSAGSMEFGLFVAPTITSLPLDFIPSMSVNN